MLSFVWVVKDQVQVTVEVEVARTASDVEDDPDDAGRVEINLDREIFAELGAIGSRGEHQIAAAL